LGVIVNVAVAEEFIVLLAGGDEDSQEQDFREAKALARPVSVAKVSTTRFR
jgi:putative component of toxin-antitoxin plasmid stabilization module